MVVADHKIHDYQIKSLPSGAVSIMEGFMAFREFPSLEHLIRYYRVVHPGETSSIATLLRMILPPM